MSEGAFCRLAEPAVGIGARSSLFDNYWQDPRWAWFPLFPLLSFRRSVNLFLKFVGCGGLKHLGVAAGHGGLASLWAIWQLVGGKKSVGVPNIFLFQ